MNAAAGSSLDAYLRLYDANGRLIGSDDDSNPGSNARLNFVANQTTHLFLSAGGFGTSTGSYTLGFEPRGLTQTGGAGADRLTGGLGADRLSGLSGNDTLIASAGNDRLSGDAGNDVLYGGTGGDTVTASNGRDLIYGEAGNDNIAGGSDTSDSMYGGAGDDRIYGGNAGGNLAYGGEGNDQLYGGDGNADMLRGGVGNDVAYGGNGDDQLVGGTGNDGMYAGTGNDRVVGDDGSDTLDGGSENDTLEGGQGSDQLIGGDGADLIRGDIRTFDAAAYPSATGVTATTVSFSNTSSMTVNLYWIDTNGVAQLYATLAPGQSYSTNTYVEYNWMLTDAATGTHLAAYEGGTAQANVFSESFNDTITGGQGADTIYGDYGDDSITGGTESDSLFGGLGISHQGVNEGIHGVLVAHAASIQYLEPVGQYGLPSARAMTWRLLASDRAA